MPLFSTLIKESKAKQSLIRVRSRSGFSCRGIVTYVKTSPIFDSQDPVVELGLTLSTQTCPEPVYYIRASDIESITVNP